MPVPDRSERQILKHLRQGQRQAWETVVCQHYKLIYSFMAYLTDDTNLAEDLTQETFLAACSSIENYKGTSSIRTWLYRIAYNKFIDSCRSIKRNCDLASGLKKQKQNSHKIFSPLRRVMADENSRCLYEAMGRLESSEYVLILLHYLQGLSFRQMAEVLDEPVGTVKWRTHKTLKKLKKILIDRIWS
jgi:RNA polymerase sigma-70 factor (ECF subfamily)